MSLEVSSEMPDASAIGNDDIGRRRHWMGILARATRDELEAAYAALRPQPAYTLLRKPESGLAMVRGRAGGTGAPFNLGEMTMTRCAVRLDNGAAATGLSFVSGRDPRQAELAALFDALLQDRAAYADLMAAVIAPIEMRIATQRRAVANDVAPTRVDFFTMVREQG
jgi:alpha-D-ribose 1-methylphosphonate 5-triphosphate synthase subunit PhnG